MKISEQQLLVLIQILKDTLKIDGQIGFDREFRIKFYELLLNQQSEELREVER